MPVKQRALLSHTGAPLMSFSRSPMKASLTGMRESNTTTLPLSARTRARGTRRTASRRRRVAARPHTASATHLE